MDLLPGPTSCAAGPKGVRMGDAPRPDRASLRWGSGADSASTSSSLVPAFLTVASVNRYMGDCAARAAGVRNSRPARAKMVWKWAELSEISGMVERAAGDVSANLRSLRDATYAESRRGIKRHLNGLRIRDTISRPALCYLLQQSRSERMSKVQSRSSW